MSTDAPSNLPPVLRPENPPVRSLAELHGGRMSIDSTLGEGAAVTVRLPVVSLARPAPPEGGAEIIQLRPPESESA